MHASIRNASCLILPLLLSACGSEFAYKPGAGSDDLSRAKLECSRGGTSYEACMQSKGWTIHKLDDENPLAVFVMVNDTRGAPDRVFVPIDKPANTPAPGQAELNDKGPADKKSPPNPLTKFNVSSWWKMGGGAEDLKASMNSCVDKLGPEHKPDMEGKLMTRGLILCLREKGWYGLQGY